MASDLLSNRTLRPAFRVVTPDDRTHTGDMTPLPRGGTRRIARVRAWLLRAAAIVCAGLAVCVTGCERASPTKPLLTSIPEIRRLRPVEAERGYPVRIRGTATYYHESSASLVVQTGSQGILVETSRVQTPIVAGREVEVVGLTGP